MQYLGGKARCGRQIADYLQKLRKPDQLYIEPFVGAGWVLAQLRGERIASDACLDLVMLWQELQQGWQPPSSLTEAEYQALKASTVPSALRAFAGFGCSFAGKWFGGYARSGNRNYANNARNSLLKKQKALMGVRFVCADYRAFQPRNALVYCDPPYAGTTGYDSNRRQFDWAEFWSTVRYWSRTNTVVVSEYNAPDDFDCVLEITTKTDMRVKDGSKQSRSEKLWQLNPNSTTA